MLTPRWRKVLSDIGANKTRSTLAVLSILVGVFAIGMIGGAYELITRDLNSAYRERNPSSATLYTDSFDSDLVEAVRRTPGVADAQGRRTATMRVRFGAGAWRSINLTVIEDFDAMRLNRLRPQEGAWPPPDRQILVERSALGLVPLAPGDPLTVEMPDGRTRELAVAGIVHDLTIFPAFFSGTVDGYITFDTAEWLGLGRDFTSLDVLADGDRLDRARVEAVAAAVRAKVESSGRTVYFTYVPPPGESPINFALVTMAVVLSMLGALLVVLSGFLITNTIAALLMQQRRQIGVMKAVGATERDIVGMYLAFVAALGVIAFALAVPLGAAAAYAATAGIAAMFNFDVTGFRLVPWVVAIQAVVSLLVPLGAALVPVLGGTRITIREAIASYGLGKGGFGKRRIDRALEQVRFLSRPLALSLRNTFRRKGRLALTLITLTLGGAIFVSVFTVQDSLTLTIDDFMNYFGEDVRVDFGRPYRDDQIAQAVAAVPGVVSFEQWSFLGARRLRPDGTESKSVVIYGLPPETPLMRPTISQGRWLLPGDESALVVTTDMLKEEPDIGVGSTVTLKVGERETEWTVVGVMPQLGNNSGFLTYASRHYVAEVGRTVGQSGNVRVVTERHDPAAQQAAAAELERAFREAGMRVTSIETNTTFRGQIKSQMDIIVVFLMIMAALITLVGGLGLMGTMSMNVIERTREIGVLRAIGASNGSVMQIVISEGVTIGLLSWALGALLSVPLSRFLSDAVGVAFMRSPLTYSFSLGGVGWWLALVTLIAALASFLPAWNAARLAVREVLAYEG